MNIIVLTNGSMHGVELLKSLKKSNIPIKCIIKEKKNLTRKELKVLKSNLGGLAFLVNLIPFKNLMYKGYRKWKYNDFTKKDLLAFSPRVEEVPHFNKQDSEHIIKECKTDLIVLGTPRIIKSNILKIPTIGTLNAHPGILPDYRGVNVIEWALYNEDKIGVTVHFVTEGIDEGKICMIEEIHQSPSYSIEDYKKKGREVAGKLMAKVVKKILKDGNIETKENDLSIGNYYKKMPKEQLLELKEKLK